MIESLETAQDVAYAAGLRFLAAARAAVRERGRFVVGLSGGSTPRALHRVLASGPVRPQVPWSRTIVLFGDERPVGPDDPDSNFRMARETLLDHVRLPDDQVLRIRGELPPETAARDYEDRLRALFHDGAPRIDLLFLGLGADGHTASLFPGTAALEETDRWVAANPVPAHDTTRITLTLPVLCAARHVVFLVTGKEKARTVAEVFGGRAHGPPHPAERVRPNDGELHVLLDRDAASLLRGG